MPRRPRPSTTSRSEHWLRILANERRDLFQHHFVELTGIREKIEWLSPVRDDDYAEYFDSAFLERLGLSDLSAALREYWPKSGPRWDGLARTAAGHVILIEAKAHLPEVLSNCSAGRTSLTRIANRFEMLKRELNIPDSGKDVSWLSPYYQFCNRIAHLHFLRSQNVDAHLVFLQFADAPDVPSPVSTASWQEFSGNMRKTMALEKHTLSAYDHELTISVNDLLPA